VSIRREKPEEIKENGPQYNYRIIFRTSEVSRSGMTLKETRREQSESNGVWMWCFSLFHLDRFVSTLCTMQKFPNKGYTTAYVAKNTDGYVSELVIP